jgi:hypothetical protein
MIVTRKINKTNPERAFRFYLPKTYFVNYLADTSHYKHNVISDEYDSDSIPDAPYFWTSELTSCIGIGLVKKSKPDMPASIGVYHSNGEHSIHHEEGNKKLAAALISFLHDCDDTSDVRVIIAFNEQIHSDERTRYSLDIKSVKELLDQCCVALSKQAIPADNYAAYLGSTTFYLTNTGNYGSLHDIIADKRLFNRLESLILNHDFELGLFHQDMYQKKPVSSGAKKILELLDIAKQQDFDSIFQAMSIFDEILRIAEQQLLAMHTLFNLQKSSTRLLYLKITAWDPLLNQPSEILLNEWLATHSYHLSPSLKKLVLLDNHSLDDSLRQSKSESRKMM